MEDPVILRKKHSRNLSNPRAATKVLTSRDNWFKGRRWWVELISSYGGRQTSLEVHVHWATLTTEEQPRKGDDKSPQAFALFSIQKYLEV